MESQIRIWIAALVLAASAAAAWAQEGAQEAAEAEEPRPLTFGIELIGEYDDNPNLGADTGDPVETPKEDFVLRAKPRLQVDYPHRDHRFKLDLAGTFREGTDTDLSEANVRGRASAELSFASGLEIEIFDFYLQTRFDQALFFVEQPDLDVVEPGVSETDGNSIGIDFNYTPKRRFTFRGSFVTTDEHFVFGSPASPPDDRDTDVYTATVELPLSLQWVAYLGIDGNDQASVQQAPRNFDERQAIAGLRWERSERVAFFLEAGQGEADFEDTAGVEFSNAVWVLGTEIDVSDQTRFEASFGRDLYDQTIYELLFDRRQTPVDNWRILVRKATQNSFASETLGRFFEATIFALRWRRDFGDRLSLASELRYFNLQADQGELMQDDATTLGRVELDYALIPEWLRIGGFAQFSSRDSNNPANEFDNTRVGFNLKLVRGAD